MCGLNMEPIINKYLKLYKTFVFLREVKNPLMKSIVCICLILLANNSAFAQSTIDRNQLRQNVTKTILRYQTAKNPTANKTTTTKERLVAKDVYNEATAAYTDSIIYQYTGIHGSVFDFNFMEYSQSTAIWGGGPITSFTINMNPALQPLVRADTSTEYVGTTTPTTILYSTYNSNNEPTTINNLFTATTGFLYQFNYNAMNQPVSVYSYSDTIGVTPSDTFTRRLMSYNSSNQLIQDSTFYYSLGSSSIYLEYKYSYDASGSLSRIDYYANSGSALYLYQTYVLTYNSSNQLIAVVTDTGASAMPYYKETFQYTSGVNYFTSDSTYTWQGSAWMANYTVSKHLNPAGVPDTVTATYFDTTAISYVELSAFNYDTYNNPVQDYDSLYYTGGSSVNTTYFHYDTYIDPTSITNITQQPVHVVVYPNPANNDITIRTDKNEPIRITIANMYGQQVVNTSLQNAGNEHAISIANISPGNYQISVYDGDNTLLHSQLFIKE